MAEALGKAKAKRERAEARARCKAEAKTAQKKKPAKAPYMPVSSPRKNKPETPHTTTAHALPSASTAPSSSLLTGTAATAPPLANDQIISIHLQLLTPLLVILCQLFNPRLSSTINRLLFND